MSCCSTSTAGTRVKLQYDGSLYRFAARAQQYADLVEDVAATCKLSAHDVEIFTGEGGERLQGEKTPTAHTGDEYRPCPVALGLLTPLPPPFFLAHFLADNESLSAYLKVFRASNPACAPVRLWVRASAENTEAAPASHNGPKSASGGCASRFPCASSTSSRVDPTLGCPRGSGLNTDPLTDAAREKMQSAAETVALHQQAVVAAT